MRRFANIVILALAAALGGCLYEGEYVRDEPQPYVPSPPPPASESVAPDTSYQAEASVPAPAGSDVANQDVFYDQLSPYGSWTYVEPYGRVWVPAVGYGWRPYYYGRWVLTDWGWTWASDDPWGWAAYHYGRWNWGIGLGWYWVPGLVWGPAWVSWRYGGGYAAWCPLGPAGVYFGYRHPGWVAVPEHHFTQPIARVAVPMHATAGVVIAAAPLAGPHATVARGGAFGPPVAAVARATGQPIRPVAASAVVGRTARAPAALSPQVRTASNPGMRSPISPRARTNDVGRAPPPLQGPRGAPGARPPAGPRGQAGGRGWSRGGARAGPSGGGARAAPSGGGGHAAPSGGGGHSSGGGHSGGKSR